MGGISRCSQVVEGLDFGGLGISSSGYLQFALERFVAEREAAGMRISSSMAEILFFSYTQLWSQVLGSDPKNEVMDISTRNLLPLKTD